MIWKYYLLTKLAFLNIFPHSKHKVIGSEKEKEHFKHSLSEIKVLMNFVIHCKVDRFFCVTYKIISWIISFKKTWKVTRIHNRKSCFGYLFYSFELEPLKFRKIEIFTASILKQNKNYTNKNMILTFRGKSS